MTVAALPVAQQFTTRANAELAAYRPLRNPHQLAAVAVRDAVELVGDIRELDPRQVAGRVELLRRRDPDRLTALVIALAALVPDDKPVSELLAWTDHLAEGTAA